MKKILCNILILGLSITTSSAFAGSYQLNPSQSKLTFSSVKKDTIAETHQFTQLQGHIDPNGQIQLVIDLNSVETNIPIRNERMQTYLFETTQYPQATLSAILPTKELNTLSASEIRAIELHAELALHGKKQNINLKLWVAKQNAGYWVSSREPVLLNAADFDLKMGIEKLQELAGLPSIDLVVPVSFFTLWEPAK